MESSLLGSRLVIRTRTSLAGLAAVILLSAHIGSPISAVAHDTSDAEATWFNSLVDEGGFSCCGNHKDCKAVDEYKASSVPGGYLALAGGEWVDVPPQKVLKRADNPTGHAVVCVIYYNGHPTARCFVRPSESLNESKSNFIG